MTREDALRLADQAGGVRTDDGGVTVHGFHFWGLGWWDDPRFLEKVRAALIEMGENDDI